MQRFAVLARVLNGVTAKLFPSGLFRKDLISLISGLIGLMADEPRARLVGAPQRA